MWTRKLLKENGKVAFKRNYWACVIVCVIAMLLGGITSVGGSVSSSSSGNSIISGADSSDLDSLLGGELGSYNEYEDLFMDGYGSPSIKDMVMSLLESIPGYVWTIVGVVMLVALILGIAMSILVSNVVAVGCSRFFIENREHKTPVGQLFYGFKGGRYLSTVLTMFMKNLYVFLWSLLLVIPGILKSYSYYMVRYILAENPELDKKRVLSISKEMMRGHRWEAFVLEFSFIGWNLLGAITFGILNVFYVNPYMEATKAEFYSAIKAEALQKGAMSAEELPGVSIPMEEVEVVF